MSDRVRAVAQVMRATLNLPYSTATSYAEIAVQAADNHTDNLIRALRAEFAEVHADGASSNDVVQMLDDWLVKQGQPTVLYA